MTTSSIGVPTKGNSGLRGLFGRNGSLRQILTERQQVRAKLLDDNDESDESETEPPYDFRSTTGRQDTGYAGPSLEGEREFVGAEKDGDELGTNNSSESRYQLRRPSGPPGSSDMLSPCGKPHTRLVVTSPHKSPASEASYDDPVVISAKVASAAAAMSITGELEQHGSRHSHRRSRRSSRRSIRRSKSDAAALINLLNNRRQGVRRNKSEDGHSSGLIGTTGPGKSPESEKDSGDDSIRSSRSISSRRGVRRTKSIDLDSSQSSRVRESSRLDGSSHSQRRRGVRRHKSMDEDSLAAFSRSSRSDSLESGSESNRKSRGQRSHRHEHERDSSRSRRGRRSLDDGNGDSDGDLISESTDSKRSSRHSTRHRRRPHRRPGAKNGDQVERSSSCASSRSRKPRRTPSTRHLRDTDDTGAESDFSQTSHSSCVQFVIGDGSVRDLAFDGSNCILDGVPGFEHDEGSLTSGSELNERSHNRGSLTLYDTPWMAA